MTDDILIRPLERVNPFDHDADVIDAQCNHICAVYNAPVDYPWTAVAEDSSPDCPKFEQTILEDFFDEPLIHIDASSSPQEIRDAILRCKHMVLATSSERVFERQRLVDRLVELRRILHGLEDVSIYDTSGSQVAYTERSLLHCESAGSLSRGRTFSFQSLSSRIGQPNRSASPNPTSHIRNPGGHEFQWLLAIRCLGTMCEHCQQPMRNPSNWILHCSVCHIVCHPQNCLRGLTRRCPSATADNPSQLHTLRTLNSFKHVIHPRTGGSVQNESGHRRVSDGNPLDLSSRLPLFRHLEVTHLAYIGANLSEQCWMCFECRRPLRPAPTRTVLAEPSIMTTLVSKASHVLDSGVSLLSRQAIQLKSEQLIPSWMPQLNSQVFSLSTHTEQLFSRMPTIKAPDHADLPNLQWAYSSKSQHDLGPVQTWEDARVLEAISRIHRPRAQSHSLRQMTGDSHRGFATPASAAQPQSSSTSASRDMKYDSARLCYYTGHFYCTHCHWGTDSRLIPACVFILGDCQPKPVCRSALLWLKYAWDRHLFRVPEPWYRYEPRARRVYALRLRAFRLSPYWEGCEKIRIIKTELKPQWLFEQPYTFTMGLLTHVLDGTLESRLRNWLQKVDEHLDTCNTCARWVPDHCVVCELGPIRPHHPNAALCRKCLRACHRSCLSDNFSTGLGDHSSCFRQTDLEPLDACWTEVLYPALRTVCRGCEVKKRNP
ncbi:hypothetical protein EG68_05182 [Paragonimus skrjabini miyazakii]|uniref:Rubicon Homology domain-containing protein n=1 Tax=Paragonimus skrjabini miyazakii TaxID=59628 RepID=A0A8S9Z3S0_9TREM|nr:hypothetical protein EG68_05182 [Paragonimus skrjabini miyazakii]